MTQRYFVDSQGAYLGSYDGPDVELPEIYLAAIEVDSAPDDARQVWDGETWTKPVTPADVEAEYIRRALTGKAFSVSGYVHGDIPLEGSPRTQTVLLALKDTARDLKEAGIEAPVLMLTDRDNGDRYLTPDQIIELVNAGKAYMQALHEAKRALKTLDPIPADYATNQAYWPS